MRASLINKIIILISFNVTLGNKQLRCVKDGSENRNGVSHKMMHSINNETFAK